MLNSSDETFLIDSIIPKDAVTQERDHCHLYDLDKIRKDNLTDVTQWPTMKCPEGFQYNFTGYFTSASTQVSSITKFFQSKMSKNC